MYARLQTIDATQAGKEIPAGMDPERARAMLVETISGHPGFAGMYLLADPETGASTLLTLWRTHEDARRASERTAAQLGPRRAPLTSDDLCEVIGSWPGAAAGEPATHALMLHFGGPLSQERVDAAAFAGRERIAPALSTVPGLVAGLMLWLPERRAQYVVSLATSPAALRELGERVMSTELLPGEDPALLPGPDRMAVHQVAAQATALTHHH